MGKLVTFDSLPFEEVAPGVRRAAITGPEAVEMVAELVRLAPGAKYSEKIPAGADRYLFTLEGEASLAANGTTHLMPLESFATLQESSAYTVSNEGTIDAELVSVLAPLPGAPGKSHAGFEGGVSVIRKTAAPRRDVPEQKKVRLYFACKEAAKTERSHAMVVQYSPDTVTNLHHHPNAESMFVLLSGKVRFTVNGEDHIVGRGQATHFPAGDKHGLRVAEGKVSFLEFHIPGVYTTVK